MNVAVYCSGVEFPQKIIEIYFLAIFGNFTLERTRKVGRFLDIVAYFLNIWRSFVHGVSKCSEASSRFWLKYFANLAYLTVYSTMISVYPFLSSLLALYLSMKIKLVNEKDDQTQSDDAHHDWFQFSAEHLNSWGALYLLWLPSPQPPLSVLSVLLSCHRTAWCFRRDNAHSVAVPGSVKQTVRYLYRVSVKWCHLSLCHRLTCF